MCGGATQGHAGGTADPRGASQAENCVFSEFFHWFWLSPGLTRMVITILVTVSPFW